MKTFNQLKSSLMESYATQTPENKAFIISCLMDMLVDPQGLGVSTYLERRFGADTVAEAKAFVLSKWHPGMCPRCHGSGSSNDSIHYCTTCAGTGFFGFTPAQVSWYLRMDKECEDGRKRNVNWDQLAAIFKSPLAQQIITAAKRVGGQDVDKQINALQEMEDEESEQIIYHNEYYQGHEQDYFYGTLQSILHQMAQVIATKAGWLNIRLWGGKKK